MIAQEIGYSMMGYIIFFLLWGLIKVNLPEKYGRFIFCTVCASFFTMLIVAFLLNFSPLLLSFMLGMTVTGIAYKLDEFIYNKRKKELLFQHFLIQLAITLLGMIAIIYLL